MLAYKKSAWTIQFLSIVIMIAAVIVTITKWFFPAGYKIMIENGFFLSSEYDIALFSLGQKVGGFLVEGIGVCLLVFGLMLVIQLMNYIKNTEYFSLPTIKLLKQITKISLIYVIWTPLSGSILSIITSLHNAPGHRIVSLTFGSPDILNIMVFCFFFLVMSILQRGYELKHEQELTV